MTGIPPGTVYEQLSIASSLAPTAKAQEAFFILVNNMRAAGESDKSIVVAITQGMLDGLMHGNWPGKE